MNENSVALGPEELIRRNIANGFIPIKCCGYHPGHNYMRDYKSAKISIQTGFTEESFVPQPVNELLNHHYQGGWIGSVIPKGYVILDVEDTNTINLIEYINKNRQLIVGVHKSRNGKHYIYKCSEDISGSTYYCTAGSEITYRAGGKNYMIFAPSDAGNRAWENFVPLAELAELPKALSPLSTTDSHSILRALSINLCREYHHNEKHRNEKSIIMLFVLCLLDLEEDDDEVKASLKIIYGDAYNENTESEFIGKMRSRISEHETVNRTEAFLQLLKKRELI
ncbi:MAG: hypothetical protein HQK96_12405, partial [Nitrospirae bacterium]|nr:hypothetical protein [Nitrospirota bacterium]